VDITKTLYFVDSKIFSVYQHYPRTLVPDDATNVI